MRVRILAFFALSCVLAAIVFLNNPHRALSQTSKASLSPTEQDVLNEINQARAHPDVYAKYLEALKPLFKDKEYRPAGRQAIVTEEGWTAVEDAIKYLRAAKPQPPLGISSGLCLAAVSHVKDQSSSGKVGHESQSGVITDRVKTFGTWQGKIAENLSYGNESARDRVLDWLMDDGTPNRGHRNALLSDNFTVVGISCGSHPEFGSMCALPLAGGFMDASGRGNQTQSTGAAKSNSNASSNSKTANSNKSAPKPRKF
jgi:uncharacterized protein YkwD